MIGVLSIPISIILSGLSLLLYVQGNSSGVEFLRIISKFRKRKKTSSHLDYVRDKTWYLAFSRRRRLVMAKKCTKNMLHGKLSRCFANRNFFWRSRCRRRRRRGTRPHPVHRRIRTLLTAVGVGGGGVLQISSDSDDFLVLAILGGGGVAWFT